jgi:ribosomal protein S18 acetylase RimI-like enzyme
MPPPLRAAAPFGIGYRPQTDEDLPFMAALYAAGRAEELAPVPWPQEAKDAFLAQQFEAQHRNYQGHFTGAEWLVIERAGAPIGRLYLVEWPSEFRVIEIGLTPGCRGSGIGGAILRDVQAMGAAAGKPVSMHVEKMNPARRLYDRLGFAFREDKGIYELIEWRPG